MADTSKIQDADEQLLAELGYKQELNRAWSGFSNFAISFSIISILAGCFTTYGQAWNNGGPIAISIGWPLISIPILIIGFCLAEMVSKYPTSGGIYWFSGKLGGPIWAWYTGWFNWIGLVAIVASVQYAAATFLNALLGLYSVDLGFINFADGENILAETFALFVLIIVLTAIVNIRRTHLLAVINNISVWWHVVGVAVIIALLAFVPDHHQSVSFVFGERINNSGFNDGGTGGLMFWFYILPLGFLLTQYTITGFDASAHLSEETHEASSGAARGVWRSIFYSALIGWLLLVAITFAASDFNSINKGLAGYGVGSSLEVLSSALSTSAFKAVLLISTIGQLFCSLACLTSTSRMTYAFSRDRAFGERFSQRLARVNKDGVPLNAVMFSALIGLVITLPALKGNSAGDPFPWAFFAVVSIGVIGLYVAFAIPIYLRWRNADRFEQSSVWNLGTKWKWMNPFAVVWTAYIAIIFCLPFTPFAVPWNDEFDIQALNYAPVLVAALLLVTTIVWHASAKKHFTGQHRTIDETGFPHQSSAP
ncbi:MAG: amino acid permease [Solirubrobacterales bacterium]|nr:amino acid permease [Solirubrobacterales bacterium]